MSQSPPASDQTLSTLCRELYMRPRFFVGWAAALAAACDTSNSITNAVQLDRNGSDHINNSPGVIYTESNEVVGNRVLVFPRAKDGSLGVPASYATGGTGTGGGLGNQGALALVDGGRFLIAVNAGSNDISLFRVTPAGLDLLDREPSGGVSPVSVTGRGNLVVVLNAGATGNITGFVLEHPGTIRSVPGFTAPLSSAASGAAQVAFVPDGAGVIVTEKATNVIASYGLKGHSLSGPVVTASQGMTPFGFAFDNGGTLVVSEAFGGAPGASAVSTYRFDKNGLVVVSPSVPDHETAACWVVITPDGRFAYTTNTGSSTVSGYRLGHRGQLSLLPGATPAGGAPIDAAISADGRFLYTLNSGDHTIGIFSIGREGELQPDGTVSGIPAGATGLVGR
jgi:6-phosphogluconolactonase